MDCPACKIPMIRRKSKYGNKYWWGCANYPRCVMTAAEHPDGTLASTPCDAETKRLREQGHRLAEDIWGKWNSRTCKKQEMYDWLKHNTKTGHFGHMMREELLTTIEKLKIFKAYAHIK